LELRDGANAIVMKFEWDEQKNLENIRRHGIDFHDVPSIFQYYVLIDLDDRHDYGEERWLGIRMLRNSLAVVVFTERDNEIIRLISVRQANKYERQKYQRALSDRLGTIRANG
jgi:uncharacterized protein